MPCRSRSLLDYRHVGALRDVLYDVPNLLHVHEGHDVDVASHRLEEERVVRDNVLVGILVAPNFDLASVVQSPQLDEPAPVVEDSLVAERCRKTFLADSTSAASTEVGAPMEHVPLHVFVELRILTLVRDGG